MKQQTLLNGIYRRKKLLANVSTILIHIIIFANIVQGQVTSEAISIPVNTVLCMIYNGIYQIAASIAVLVFVFAGIKFVASMDDPGKRKSAKDTMIAAIIGLIIVSIGIEIVGSVLTSVLSGTTVYSTCTG